MQRNSCMSNRKLLKKVPASLHTQAAFLRLSQKTVSRAKNVVYVTALIELQCHNVPVNQVQC